ncbi:cyclin-dependent protein kinase inhibitor SMR6-like [Andrographis paniculata]|uniref:cyclin-dependent protein kinase inhibitor SMR6-like n=1 Tax=Andrographis paniculata TaxID=175694 RepID=UPI0021E799AB|nr:cyclin-dependent protein kinase inhibitor SMR6-like [Andrographis paniculata]
MGFSKNHHQIQMGLSKESEEWVTAAAIRSPLKPLKSVSRDREEENNNNVVDEEATTPTARGSRIPGKLACPPPPRKRRPASSKWHYNNGVREFFNPPDLESVFVCHAGRAN